MSKTQKPFLIGVSGGTASGKSSLCENIINNLEDCPVKSKEHMIVLSMDSFYKEIDADDVQKANKGEFNFDHPNAFDFKLLLSTLKKVLNREEAEYYEYDYSKNMRSDNSKRIPASVDIIILEGILTFYNREIRELFDMKIFVDSDADTRLSRRVLRDTDRGRELNTILHQYTKYVKPAFEEFCLPTKKYADLIIPRGVENQVGTALIVQHINEVMLRRCNNKCTDLHNVGPSGDTGPRRLLRTTSESQATVSRPH